MNFAFEMKVGYLKKNHDLQIVPKCNLLKMGVAYHYSNGHPACTVEHFANIFTV